MNEESQQYERVEGLPVSEATLPDGLRFTDIENSLEGRVSEGRAYTLFLPQGYATPTWIHIAGEDVEESYTLIISPLTGNTEIRNGRVEMQRKGI